MTRSPGDESAPALAGAVPLVAAEDSGGDQSPLSAHASRYAERLLLCIALAVIAVDQFSKWWIRTALTPGDERAIIPGFAHFSHVVNHGAAWGMLEGQRWLLVGISIIVVIALAASVRQIAVRGPLVAVGMGLIFGGAVGNLIDRIIFGHVTDMIDMDTPIALVRNFPVFNVADSALTVGVCVLIVHTLFGSRGSEAR